jgi:predicted transposase YbfD/YdcC
VKIYAGNLLGDEEGWIGIERLIMVEREGFRDKKPYMKVHYYISSLKENKAQEFAKGIRSHWGIENSLHWVKDVIQNEDRSRIKDGNIAGNLSIIKSTVINLFRLNGNQSIKMAIEKYCNRIPESVNLLNQRFTHLKN